MTPAADLDIRVFSDAHGRKVAKAEVTPTTVMQVLPDASTGDIGPGIPIHYLGGTLVHLASPDSPMALESRQARRQRTEEQLRETTWDFRRRHVTELPGTLYRRGLYTALSVMVATAALMAFSGGIALFGVALVFVILGASILADNVVSPRPMQDPRLGTLLLMVGIGSLLVAIVAIAT
jgi:hypothetical protein